MAFRTYSLMVHGVPTSDETFNDADTYVAVISSSPNAIGISVQATGLAAIKKLFNVIYEGPVAFNHFHYERKHPSQKIIVFEKKCPPELNPAPDVSPKAVILGETI